MKRVAVTYSLDPRTIERIESIRTKRIPSMSKSIFVENCIWSVIKKSDSTNNKFLAELNQLDNLMN